MAPTRRVRPSAATRRLVLVLGDQLDPKSAAFDGFDPARDALWMAEVCEEAKHVWSHKARIALFLSAMRHFRDTQRASGVTVQYSELDDPENGGSFAAELDRAIRTHRPERLVVLEPGEFRVREELAAAAARHRVPLEVRTDRHFLATVAEFKEHSAGRKQLRLEYFYRDLRKKTGTLLDDGKPIGGAWNFDASNREPFPKAGPGLIPEPIGFEPDATTRAVLGLVERTFPDHPGSLKRFDWPVTPGQARTALDDFEANRLAGFGRYQDAMWAGRPYLFHSRLSVALNLHLLDPREPIRAAERAYRDGRAPLAAVEGFIRQILGWREYVRGVYWQFMPEYLERNSLHATLPLPRFYWTGDTEMNCLRHAIMQTLEFGYAHHIQRLMVTGLFALLLGVNPKAVHEWYLAVYVDAVEWVELPNTLGMSQFADGGVMASKPYVASGKYVQRMSNYCRGCRYAPDRRTGPDACPFTVLYWDFLMRHEGLLAANPRMVLQVRNLARVPAGERRAIRERAGRITLELV